MNILLVYAHHEPGSLTGSLKNTALSILSGQGHNIMETEHPMGYYITSAQDEKVGKQPPDLTAGEFNRRE